MRSKSRSFLPLQLLTTQVKVVKDAADYSAVSVRAAEQAGGVVAGIFPRAHLAHSDSAFEPMVSAFHRSF